MLPQLVVTVVVVLFDIKVFLQYRPIFKKRFDPEEHLEIHVNYFFSSTILLFYTLPLSSGTATGRVLVNIHPHKLILEYDVCFTVVVEFVTLSSPKYTSKFLGKK